MSLRRAPKPAAHRALRQPIVLTRRGRIVRDAFIWALVLFVIVTISLSTPDRFGFHG